MTVFPAIIDSRPSYFEPESRTLSLGLMPYGHSTILTSLSDAAQQRLGRRPTVVRTFESSESYEAALSATGTPKPSQTVDELYSGLETAEPSDWILLIDPRCWPGDGYDAGRILDELLAGLTDTPRFVRHLVALDWNTAGTSERVELDADGRVRRIQRYYDAVTWTVTSGVLCSLIPVSSLMMGTALTFTSLEEFRSKLAAKSLACRDLPYRGAAFNLDTEAGLLRLTERVMSAAEPASAERDGVRIHPSARLLGPVAIHHGADIADDVTIVGPAVIGAGVCIERGAVVAQSVIAAGGTVKAGAVLRHRVATGPASSSSSNELFDVQPDEHMTGFVLQEEAGRRRLYPTVKLIIESGIAAVSLVILSPLLLTIAALIKLESKGSVFYGDLREAKDGKPFRCFKFRTMVAGADQVQRELMAANQVDGPQFKMTHDPRVTPLGRLLRAISLDELPQLFNVLLGQMSLVGPRPSPFRENQTCVPWRDARLSVRPGITGLWQVCRHDRASGDFHQWIYYDMQYVRHMSAWVDLKILAATVFTLGGKGHVPLSWIVSSTREAAAD
jgi:lipopolysaccharide/colanic/teichoic acid biosynthesis glycosyltransferase